jgi:hypothetical protein
MGLTIRDRIASVLVAAATLLAIGWFANVLGLGSVDLTWITVAVLALGVPPSAMAVVPGFSGLIHGSRIYLLASSALGIAATVAALATIANGTRETFAVLVVLTVVLWAVATLRHGGMLATARLQTSH